LKILVIPDVQAKPDEDFTFLTWIGEYITEKKPDVIVCIGDFTDMPSLCTYDVGTKGFEGRRYTNDIGAGQEAMMALLLPIEIEADRQKQNKHAVYRPRKIMLIGNHEQRINKAINRDPKLEGLISLDDLAYAAFGWEIHPFLEVVVVEGVAFSHYFTSGVMGRPITSAQALLSKKHMSCIAGHQQGKQIATGRRADGRQITGIIAGSCYMHDEGYLDVQSNQHWRGLIVLHDVKDGVFDEMFVSLDYLKQKYGGKK
jgi:Calcineurin-like phosphoesterase.